MRQVAKIFMNGRSQAVRLLAAFRFAEKEVYIRKDEKTGDVIISSRNKKWDAFFEARKGLVVPYDFLSPEERNQGEHRPDPFADWEE